METLPLNARNAVLDFDGWLGQQPEQTRRGVTDLLSVAPDQAWEKKRFANTLWMAERSGLPLDEVDANYAAVRGGLGEQLGWADDWKDDDKFHARILQESNREQSEQWLIEGKEGDEAATDASLIALARKAAVLDQPWTKALAIWSKSAAGKEGYDAGRLDTYQRLAQDAHEEMAADAVVARPASEAVWQALEKDDDAAALAAFRPLTPEQRALTVSLIQKRGKKDGAETGAADATGKTLARAGERLFLGAGQMQKLIALNEAQGKFKAGSPVPARSTSALDAITDANRREIHKEAMGGVIAEAISGPMRTLSEDEATEWNKQVDEAIEDAELRVDLQRLANESVDPIRGGSGLRNKIWLPAVESLPTMATMAVPGAGTVAVVVSARSYQQDEYTRLRGQDIERGEALRLSAISGGAQAAMDYAGVKWLQKYTPRTVRELLRFKVAPGSTLGRAGARFALGQAGEVGTELIQDHIVPAAVDDMLSHDPRLDRNWGTVMTDVAKAVPDTFLATLLPTALFAAAGARGDMEAAGKLMKANSVGLQLAGYTPEQAAEITAAQSPEAVRDLLNKHQPTSAPTPAERVAVVERLVTEATTARQEADAEAEATKRALASQNITFILKDGKWIVSDGENSIEAENGMHAMQVAASMSDTVADYDTAQVEQLAANMEAAEALDASQPDGQKSETRLYPEKLVTALDKAAESAESEEAIMDRLRIMDEQNGLAPGTSASGIVLGENAGSMRDGIYEDLSKINAGGTVLDVFEERIEGRLKAAISSGTMAREEARAVLDVVEAATGDRYVTGDSDSDLIEGVSSLLRAELYRTRKEGGPLARKGLITRSLTAAARSQSGPARTGAAKALSFIRAARAYLGQLIKRSWNLKKARAEGKIGPEVDQFLAKLAGVEEQAVHNKAVMKEVGRSNPDRVNWQRTEEIVDGLRRESPLFAGESNFKGNDSDRGYARYIDHYWDKLPTDLKEWWITRPDYRDAETGEHVSVLHDGVRGTHVFNARDFDNIDPADAWEAQPTSAIGSADMLENVAQSLESRRQPPERRMQGFAAAAEDFRGMARSVRSNDEAGDALSSERISAMEESHARKEHATTTGHLDAIDALKAEQSLEMGAAQEEKWTADQRDALNVRHGREIDRLKNKQRNELRQVRERHSKEMAGAKKQDPKKNMLRSLAAFDALLMKFPAEVRGKVGGFTRLASLETNEAREKYLKDRIEKLDAVLETFLRKEYTEEIGKLFKRATIRKGKEGEKPLGHLGADTHYLMESARVAMTMTDEQKNEKLAGLESRLLSGELTAEQEALAQREWDLINLVGDWKNADAAKRAAAFAAVSELYDGGYLEWVKTVAERRERRDAARGALMLDTGKLGTPKERQAREEKDLGWIGQLKTVFLSLSSFEEVLASTFGLKSTTARRLADAERAASYKYEDANQAIGDEVQDLFTRLGGGSALEGEKIRFRLSQKSVDTKNAWGTLSEMETIQALLMWAQEDGKRHMGEYLIDQAWIDGVAAQLSPEGKAVMAFIQSKYASEYPALNSLYRERHGVNLPSHDNYAPLTVKPQQARAGEMIDPVSGQAMTGNLLTPGSLRTRSKIAAAEPQFRDALQTLLGHTRQIEHWKAYYDVATEMNAIFGNRNLGNSIEAAAGAEAVTVLKKWNELFSNGGHRDAATQLGLSGAYNRMSGRFARFALVGRVGTLVIQSTQLAASLAEMPTGAYVKRFGKLLAGQLDWKGALDSDFIQRRYRQAPPIVQQAMAGLRSDKPNAVKHAVARLGTLISGADALFTAGTYSILLDYHRGLGRKAGLSGAALESHAHHEAVRATERVAQPTRMGARSAYENMSTHPALRLGWAFASEARQKLALGVWAARRMKDDPAKAARTAAVVWGVGGLMAQIIRSAWKDMRDDEDDEWFDERNWGWERLVTTAVAGPLYGFPILGEAIERALAKATGAYAHSSGPFSEIANAVPATKRLATFDFMDSDEPIDDVMRDVEAILMAAGLFNETAASAASLLHPVRDAAGVVGNIVGE